MQALARRWLRPQHQLTAAAPSKTKRGKVQPRHAA